jgi:hypothetical protein
MSPHRRFRLLSIALIFPVSAVRAEDKSRFTLLDPTPAGQMRPFDSDRPGTTESPITVDAGHFQAEFSFAEFTHDRTEGVTTDTLLVLPANLKVGLLNNVDLQFLLQPYVNERTEGRGTPAARNEDFGDTTVRLKVNLLGDDGGPFALAVMPAIKFPTGTGDAGNDHYEGGILLPVRVKLPAEFDLGAMLEVDFIRDVVGNGYGTAITHSVTLSHSIAGDLGGYVEYAGTSFVNAGATYQAVLGAGVTYGLGPNAQLDAGVNVGLSDSADDFNVFAGLAFRI